MWVLAFPVVVAMYVLSTVCNWFPHCGLFFVLLTGTFVHCVLLVLTLRCRCSLQGVYCASSLTKKKDGE